MISDDEAVKLAKKVLAHGDGANFKALAHKIIELIERQRWIPVSERLPPLSDFRPNDPTRPPKTTRKILVAVDDGRVFETIYTGLGFANVGRDHSVTHWMPLPQPPEQ